MEMIAYSITNVSKSTVSVRTEHFAYKAKPIQLKPDTTYMFTDPNEYVAFKPQIAKFVQIGKIKVSEVKEKAKVAKEIMTKKEAFDLRYQDSTTPTITNTQETIEIKTNTKTDDTTDTTDILKLDTSALKSEYKVTQSKKRKAEIAKLLKEHKKAVEDSTNA